MADPLNLHKTKPSSFDFPANGGVAVTPDNDNDIPGIASRALYVGVSGDINVVCGDGSALLFKNVPVGILPVKVARVLSTNTSASQIIALV
jgi:hypothetical protein